MTLAIGVLALQGDVAEHLRSLAAAGVQAMPVRRPDELNMVHGLVIPGGESTTIYMGLEREGMCEPLRELARGGMPVLGSCAGLILLDRDHLGVMDIRARRNAFGRQIRSFETDLQLSALSDGPLRGIFIRAPWIAEHGPEVEILAEVDGHAVAARQGPVLAVAFHSELSEDDRVHRLFLRSVRDYAAGAARWSASQP